jgi:hypothetical protein
MLHLTPQICCTSITLHAQVMYECHHLKMLMIFKFAVPRPALGESSCAAKLMMSVAVPSGLYANRVEAMDSRHEPLALNSTGECPSRHVHQHTCLKQQLCTQVHTIVLKSH